MVDLMDGDELEGVSAEKVQEVVEVLATALLIAGVFYLIVAVPGHYAMGYDARSAHNVGVLAAALSGFVTFALMAKKKGWMDKEDEEKPNEILEEQETP